MREAHRIIITGDLLEEDGVVWKRCTGPCGQNKQLDEFGYRRMHAFQDVLRVQPQCKTCRGENTSQQS